MLKLEIDSIPVEVPEGTSVLEAARAAGIKIPTLCYLEKVQGIGACRVCLVEIEGHRDLMASCVMPAADGMVVRTNNQRVRDARRTVVELLLSEHEGDCRTCERSGNCELESLARTLGIREVRYLGERRPRFMDSSTAALVRDSGKCISCRRCVTVCNEVQTVGALFPQGRGFSTVIGPAFRSDLDEVACVQCGQCAAVCPVGAITGKEEIAPVWEALDDPDRFVVVQTAPAIRAALGECFGYPPGTRVTGKMVTGLRRLGFDAVFDTNFSADLTIMEEGSEFLERLSRALRDGEAAPLPQFTSCCPGWIKFAEYSFPELLPNLSSCKSPQQMLGAVAKTYYAGRAGIDPDKITVVSVMPCTAKKFECRRPEMRGSGFQDVDYVLTTRELGRMMNQAGIDFASLPESAADSPLGLSSGAADIFANTGGVMEAALRTAYALVTGRSLPGRNLHVDAVEGLEGVKEAVVPLSGCLPEWSFLEGVELKVAVAHGLGNARRLAEAVLAGRGGYHFVEVMACPGGCIGGGGQPRITTDRVRAARMAAIFQEDEGKELRMSHQNPEIVEIYEEYLGRPLGEISHRLLHTRYRERSRV
ncbi:MAG TPA: NADH-dependent [FeFe] hydrogenase, group A6 [bacterium]|nr:NADH-dependent [FeFe] hydrogenase, group A6 [bacterium]HPQ65756.1 NADH-dependent [FeFe] hydrogenase, group A6 [bacterium]